MSFKCVICNKALLNRLDSFNCDFCKNWYHYNCNLPPFISNGNTQSVGSCLKCNCKLFPFSACYSFNDEDARVNFLHPKFQVSVPLLNQNVIADQESEDTIIDCKYLDCDNFNRTFPENKSKNLSFFHLNINSLPKHFENLNCYLNSLQHKFKIIGISETRITNTTAPHKLDINGYSALFNKTEASAGGTALYIAQEINFKQRKDLSNCVYSQKELESTFCELNLKNQPNLIVGCIYKHPGMNMNTFLKNHLNPAMQKILKENKDVVLLGDFNIDLLKSGSNIIVNTFIDTLQSFCLLPSISLPTRVTESTKTLIDNIFFTPNKYRVSSGNLLAGLSDHLPQFLIFDHNIKNAKTKISFRDWKNFDEEKFLSDFSNINWETCLQLELEDPDISFDKLFNTITALVDQHVPLKFLSRKQVKNFSKPWITKGIRTSIKKRDKILKSFIKENDQIIKDNLHKTYKNYRNRLVEIIRKSKCNYYKNYFDNNIKNSKSIWKGINELIENRKSSRGNDTISLKIEGIEVSNANTIAEEFNKHFTSIADKIRSNIALADADFRDNLGNRTLNSLFFRPIESTEIIKLINSLKSKSSGPFSIQNRILKTVVNPISDLLAKIFNLSFQTGKFITSLKTAKVIPIYKNKGSPQDVTNYRPISLLSNIDKIFEKLVHSRVVKFFDKNEILFKNQFGFRSKHSTTHALINLTEEIRCNVDKDMYCCGTFIDLQKAFDTVDHEILLTKLSHYGVRGNANLWFRSYLSNRKQFVFVSDANSVTREIDHGVPQGSVLGPLLFIVYINDLPNVIKNSLTSLFADDTCLLSSAPDIHSLEVKVNEDLQSLSAWLKANKIAINTSKTEVLLFRSKRKKVLRNPHFTMDGQTLSLSPKVRYLGVILDEHLSWSFQTEFLASKLRKANGILTKLRHYIPLEVLISIYYSLFHSHISYGAVVWGQNIKSNSRLCILQKKAVRIITFSRHDSHSKPLFIETKIPFFTEFIFKLNVMLVHQTLNKITPITIQNILRFTPLTHQYPTRNRSLQLLLKPKAKTLSFGLNSISY